MRGYRKLKPGEKTRKGDEWYSPVTGGWRHVVGGTIVNCDKRWSIYRREARTNGTPPGWRWADSGEEWFHSYDGDQICEHDDPHEVASSYEHAAVMPYPDDFRKEAELEYEAEEYACAMMYLDNLGIPRQEDGRGLSLVGRLKLVLDDDVR